ncbi:hypothetical protein [Ornithinimicrobium sp. Y1694]|uniref:hypothetical protein n=1 Tax=Ornithinimicrobium sp. Y1694 TaxID=3418590 RepID=UPI003CF4ECF4
MRTTTRLALTTTLTSSILAVGLGLAPSALAGEDVKLPGQGDQFDFRGNHYTWQG